MKKHVKKLWLRWLRDPSHKQAHGMLRDKNSFCCLGGLCEVFRTETGQTWGKQRAGHKHATFFGNPFTLPDEVMAWAGLEDCEGGEVTINGVPRQLSIHNDGGATFAEIADAIEREL